MAAAGKTCAPTRLWYVALVLALVLPLAAAAIIFPADVREPAIADLFVHEAAMALPGGTERRAAALPYRCHGGQEGGPCGGSFRIVHHHPEGHRREGDGRLWSLYVPAFQGTLTVSLNGAAVASSAWTKSVADSSALVPLLIPLPEPLLRPGGDNFVDLVLATPVVPTGFLDAIAIGPDEVLRPDYQTRLLLFSILPGLTGGWQIAVALALLLVWVARPRERLYLVFGILMLFLAMQSLPMILGDRLPLWALRIAGHGRMAAAFLILPAAWLYVGRRPPVPPGLFLIPPLAVAVMQSVLDPVTHLWIVNGFVLPCIGLLLAWAGGVVFRAAFGRRDAEAMILLGVLLIAAVFTLHDALVMRDALGGSHVLLGRLVSPFTMSVIGGTLIWRFARTMNALDQFSARLERDVAAAGDALRASFAREQAQIRTATLQAERVRLMSDLHDGIAGQLVAILSLCELKDAEPDAIIGTVRAALTDLRLIVASLDDYGGDLGAMLGVLRERIEPQVTAHGMTLVWRMAGLPDLDGLHPGAVLTLYRIFQEAATNACRHSGAAGLRFEAGPSPLPGYAVRLCLRDDGCGAAAGRPAGHGLTNMRRRAESVGAVLGIVSGSGGTAVICDLPARLA